MVQLSIGSLSQQSKNSANDIVCMGLAIQTQTECRKVSSLPKMTLAQRGAENHENPFFDFVDPAIPPLPPPGPLHAPHIREF